MLSLTVNPPKPFSLSTTFLSPHPHPHPHKPPPSSSSSSFSSYNNPKPLSISALMMPPSSPSSSSSSSSSSSQRNPQQQLYQPFRPPPSPLPTKFRNLDTNSRLEILRDRLGLWFEYAPLIPSLIQEGFNTDSIEEIAGISNIEQNRLVVAAKVRNSLVDSKVDPNILSYFDSNGAELLYEIRLLSNQQRAAAVKYVVERSFDARQAEDLAKAMKDKPRRRGDKGYDAFNDELPGDCLAYMYYRQAQEHSRASTEEARVAALERALEYVESDNGRKLVEEELEGKKEGKKGVESGVEDGVKVPVVRMKVGEAAEASVLVILPVSRAEEKHVEVEAAPWECKGVGEFGVVETEKEWRRWVVLPGWVPILGLKNGGVAVAFPDAQILPWRVKKWNKDEAILVVADRKRKEVTADDGFYLVCEEEELKVERGVVLKEMGVSESLGTVVLVVRPPKDEDDEHVGDEDWE